MSSIHERVQIKSGKITDNGGKDHISEIPITEEEQRKDILSDDRLDQCRRVMRELGIHDLLQDANNHLFQNGGRLVGYDGGLKNFMCYRELSPDYADGDTTVKNWNLNYFYSTQAVLFFTDIKRREVPDDIIGLFKVFKGYTGIKQALVVSTFTLDSGGATSGEQPRVNTSWGIINLNIIDETEQGQLITTDTHLYVENERIDYPLNRWVIGYRTGGSRFEYGDLYPTFETPKAFVYPETREFEMIKDNKPTGDLKNGLNGLKDIIADDLASQLVFRFGANLKNLHLYSWGRKVTGNVTY